MAGLAVFLTLFCTIGAGLPDWTLNSDWETEYQDFNGRTQRVAISLRNGSGRYGQTGILLNTFYCQSAVHLRGDISPALIGEWRMNGQRGYFVFREPKPNGDMDGYWGQFDSQGNPFFVIGSWDGKLKKTYPTPVPQLSVSSSTPRS